MPWGCPETVLDYVQATFLKPLTIPYQLVLYLHQGIYRKHLLPTSRLSCPVISVGNITVGGTGKSPLIIELAESLIANGHKVGILSRGYKRRKSNICTVVSDGLGHLAGLEEAGDEPLMIAQAVPKSVVIVSKDRAFAGYKAIDEYDCQILLLDDGFQHWLLQRDYDIVLIDYADEPWKDALLPAGRLREPLSALNRAQHIIISKVPQNFDEEKLRRLQEFIHCYSPRAAISICQYLPTSINKWSDGQWIRVPLAELNNSPLMAFCGIAKAQAFFADLKNLGLNLVEEIAFADHHPYTQSDIENLQDKARRAGAQHLITTNKDLVKLHSSPIANELLTLNQQLNWLAGTLDIVSIAKSIANQKLAALTG